MRLSSILCVSGILLSSCTPTPTPVTLGSKVPVRSIQLEVPFSPQAPFANWDAPYQEACEEMSLITVHHFLEGTDLTPEIADVEILELIQWEEEHGYKPDVTLKELAEIAEEYYGYTATIIENPTEQVLKEQLMKKNPVIVPAAGRMLGNKYYSGEGPWYHMLVLTGYTTKKFMTNDPGTRRGEGFSYKVPILMNAIHDWTGTKEEIGSGDSRVLVLTKKK